MFGISPIELLIIGGLVLTPIVALVVLFAAISTNKRKRD